MIDTVPAEGTSSIVVRVYRARKYEALIESFHRDAVLMLSQGFEPAGQHYVEGQWSLAMAIVATILIPIVIGAFMWAYLLTRRPTGVLSVTYLRRAAAGEVAAAI
jgi:hypothetical protein